MELSVADDDIATVASISLAISSKSTDIDVATDMSGHEVTSIPEMEIDDRGVTSTLRISSMLTMSGVPEVPKSSVAYSRKVHQQSAMDEEAEWA